jgi:D-glycero-alpha-D-manno-heptose-7-phosphate kinase
MNFFSRAPLRLGFAGGGTDVAAYSDLFGGQVINATLDRYVYASFNFQPTSEGFTLESIDKGLSENWDNLGQAIANTKLPLHVGTWAKVANLIKQAGGTLPGFRLSTFTDAPIGSGLGASSTLTVAMLKVFDNAFDLQLDENLIADYAYTIERVDCGQAGGRQDQYAAAFGGFNAMTFEKGATTVEPLIPQKGFVTELESSIILYFSGVSRFSSQIIQDQITSTTQAGSVALEAMHGLKQEARQMKEAVVSGDYDLFVEALLKGWENKKKSSTSVSTAQLEQVLDAAFSAGAHAGKISGAGGGGFMFFCVPLEKRADVVRTLRSFGGETSNCHFTYEGAQSWTSKRK